MEQRFTMITLGVDDLGRARAFYEEGLGWKPSSASNEIITFFQMGGCVLGLFARDALAADMALPNPPAAVTGGFAIAHNARNKEEVDALLAKAESAGARLIKPAKEAVWGGYSGYFLDPDGHAWEVAYNPYWEMAENGAVTIPS